MTLDISNAFVQTPMPDSDQKVIMRSNVLLVVYLDELFPNKYSKHITYQNNTKILYVEMKKALYGMMLSSLFFYKHFQKDLESIRFIINPYNICVANRNIDGHQQTVTWYVDNVKVCHKSSKINKEFFNWCEQKYVSNLNGNFKLMEGKKHDYLGMILDCSIKGKLKVDMKKYIKDIVETFPENLSEKIGCPWNLRLFKINHESQLLDKDKRETFHIFVMKHMFLAKRARPDILVGIRFLSTTVLRSNEEDWKN